MGHYIVVIKFVNPSKAPIDNDILLDVLRILLDNGILIDYFRYPRHNGTHLEYYGLLTDKEAFNSNHYIKNTKNLLLELSERYGFHYDLEIDSPIEGEVESRINETTGFILHPGAASPIRSIDTFLPFPLYLLPPTSTDGTNYFNLVSWERDYEALYRIWFRGNIDEGYFLNLLSNYESPLTLEGLQICRLISRLTSKRCYYYLFRSPNEENHHRNNQCPGCGNDWKLPAPMFNAYEYKCDHCCIVS